MAICGKFRLRTGGTLLLALVLQLTPNVHAQVPVLPLQKVVSTDWGRIVDLRSAWADDAMGIHHSAPFLNSQRLSFAPAINGGMTYKDECSSRDGYATSTADPGRKLHHALLVGAFLHGKEVKLTLQGCAYDRPRVIAVEVR